MTDATPTTAPTATPTTARTAARAAPGVALVSEDGRANIYVIADPITGTLVDAHPSSRVYRVHERLVAEGRSGLVVHNVTHARCPTWIRSIVEADPGYRAQRARTCLERASGCRSRAEPLLREADELEDQARRWSTEPGVDGAIG